jgi:uncharacterized protein
MSHNKKEKETRTIDIEFQADPEGTGRTVEGYAALYSQVSGELYGFEEVIEPGAFDNADFSDVRALFNHDPNQILARTSSGTMSVATDTKGLRYSFEMPDTTLGNDLLVMMKRGDISQSSFAFTIKEDSWEERAGMLPLRHIREVETIYDVSPVTYPAYTQTTATARSLDKLNEPKPNEYDYEIEVELA